MQGRSHPPAPTGPADPAAEAIAVVDELLAALDAVIHRPAPLERGFSTDVGGFGLHVGVRVRSGMLEAQAEVAPPGTLDPAWLLHRNRRDLRVVRYGTTGAGATWVHGELPLEAVTPERLDELLGRLLQAAEVARGVATRPSAPPRRPDDLRACGR